MVQRKTSGVETNSRKRKRLEEGLIGEGLPKHKKITRKVGEKNIAWTKVETQNLKSKEAA